MPLLVRLGIGAAVCLAVGLLGSATGSASSTADDPTFACGAEQGPAWSVPGGVTGRTWYVISIQSRSQCADAHDWAVSLGGRIAGRAGTDVQVFHSGAYGCVMVRSQLFAACRVGNGGHGSEGVLVLGNPAQNPYVSLFHGTYAAGAQRQVANLEGVPGPTATSLCKLFDGPRWSFKAADGHQVSGSAWRAVGDAFPDGCPAAGDLRAASAASISADAMSSRSFLTSGRRVGDWGCVAAHDYAWPGGANSIVGVPVAGCARVVYPFGTSSLSGELEQVIVVPDISGVTPGAMASPATGVTTDVQQQVVDTLQAANRHGVMAVAVVAAASRVVGGTHPETNARTSQGVVQCDRRRVGGALWQHGGARGDGWLTAVRGGYPCELAAAVFTPFLAYLDTIPATSAPPGAALHRYGWDCRANRTALSATCTFDPPDATLATAIGRAVPSGLRIAVSAAYPGAQAQLLAAVGG